MRYLPLLLVVFYVGCAASLYPGKREAWRHEQRVDMPAGNYLMNCVWEQVPWETNWGNFYLNCEQTKEE